MSEMLENLNEQKKALYSKKNNKSESKHYVSYYFVGRVERSKVWVLVSAVRATEHVCFDRTLDVAESIFEFFVSPSMVSVFLEVMDYLKKERVLLSLEQLPNRFTY